MIVVLNADFFTLRLPALVAEWFRASAYRGPFKNETPFTAQGSTHDLSYCLEIADVR